jgi:hypothetical protein
MAAIEYEIRIWDADGRAGVERDQLQPGRDRRYGRFVDELVRRSEALGIELAAVHTEAGPGCWS